ncbi:MAG: type II toxin-antitoxin system mRNA interferase toxin, RelE/StbE family [Microgenomates group bacterium]
MDIYYSSKFVREYKRLSPEIKRMAEEKEKIFRKNPHDPRLKTHALQNKLHGFWSFSINRQIRIIFEFGDENTIWFHSVGSHDIYKQF